ncbi:MAG: hypothetical protein ABIH83_02500 [Candidatus Micrarchaeota archaeon]
MQTHKHKKEKENVVKCPRCGAGNVATQKRCGKCGYVFPDRGPKKGQNGAIFDAGGGKPPQINIEGQIQEGEEEIPAPPVPKEMSEKGKSEGMMKERGEWQKCPKCGADVSVALKRCSRCGLKKVRK